MILAFFALANSFAGKKAMSNSRAAKEKYRTWGKGYYHLCTDRLEGRLLFNNDTEYRKGMATVALAHLKFNVKILTFELMPNHVHIVLYGTGEQSIRVASFLKRRFTEHLVADGFPPLPDNIGFKLTPIPDKDALKNQIVYSSRNPYEKNYCVPGGNKWGAGYLFFNEAGKMIRGKKVCELKLKDIREISSSREEIPDNWEVHPELGILPRNFVLVGKVEGLFGTPKEYLTRLVKDYETMVKIAADLGESIDYSEEEIRDIVSSELRNMYPGRMFKSLSGEEKLQAAVSMNSRLALAPAQLASALFISELSISQAIRSKDYGIRPSKAGNQ